MLQEQKFSKNLHSQEPSRKRKRKKFLYQTIHIQSDHQTAGMTVHDDTLLGMSSTYLCKKTFH